LIQLDSFDVDYLVKNFTIAQLVKEINHESQRAYEERWDDYIKSCQLAIDILKSYVPEEVHHSTNKSVFESIESIKARYDIVSYIGQFIKLKKSGNKFNGVCPFHSEKKGSFFVYADQQRWHCFGACNTGGDIITFVQKYERLDTKEAIQRLANG
jgi:hypothetical protein